MIPRIDTHQTVKSLMKGKLFTKSQAEALVEVISQPGDHFAEKSDVKSLRGELKAETESLRKDIFMVETKLVGQIETSVAKLQRNFTIQIFGAIGLLFVALQVFGR